MINNTPIFNGLDGAEDNGLCESTPQIQFGSGLPHIIPSVKENEMSADFIQSIQNPSMLKAIDKSFLTENDMCAIVTEVNTVEDNPKDWWYDTGATTHICVDKDMFCTYQHCKSEERLLMENTGSSIIEGFGEVKLALTSGKKITLKNVKHVPDMRKNLISGSLLSKAGLAVTFESDKLVLKKQDVLLGKGYVKNGLVKMCVTTVLPTNVEKNVSIHKHDEAAYLVEAFNIWHERLGHVNYKSVQRLINLNLIPKCKLSKDKCEVCVQVKLTKTPFPHVERSTEPLGLIHTTGRLKI